MKGKIWSLLYIFFALILITIVVIMSIYNFKQKNINQSINNTVEIVDNDIESETLKKIEIETDKGVDNKVETKTEEYVQTIIEETKPVFYLSDYERKIVECIVMGESGGEPYDGQVLVAQCLINACLRDGLQPSEVREKYSYAGWNENPSESVKEAVNAVFDDGYKVTEEFILYFYAPKYSKGKWHETQRFVIEVGGHRFFAEWDAE